MRSGAAHSQQQQPAQRRRGASASRAHSSRRDPHREGAAPSLFDGLGGEPTLDDVLAGAWEGLTAHSVVSCPVCGDEMEPQYGAHALPIHGACIGCGTTLS